MKAQKIFRTQERLGFIGAWLWFVFLISFYSFITSTELTPDADWFYLLFPFVMGIAGFFAMFTRFRSGAYIYEDSKILTAQFVKQTYAL
ncbi:MAG: hypothetical protein V4543_11730 [Bacteroidota bacterium]